MTSQILWIAVLASFVAFLDGTIVNVALPAIDRELGGGLVTQQWVVDGYFITLGAIMLVAGSISDAYGRSLVMRIGLIGFGIASVIITVAPDPLILIIARMLQGAAGAFLVPSSLALISAHFSGVARAKAIGTWTALTTGAMIVGPLIGGVLVDFASWRFAFLINVVPIAVTLWLLRTVPDPPRQTKPHIDILGAVLSILGLGGLVFGLIEQPRLGWGHPAIPITLLGGAVLFVLFLLRQKRVTDPILPLDLFRARNFWVGNITTTLMYGALSLNGFVLAIYLQEQAGLSATAAGLASLPTTIMMILFSSTAGRLSGSWGPRLFMGVGPILMGLGSLMLLLVREDFNYWWQVLPAMIVFGLGLAATVSPLTATILGAIEEERSGIASAVNNAISRVAGLIAIALVGTVVGGTLDLSGFYRAAVFVSVLLIAGGLVSLVGIRNPAVPAPEDSRP
ncbi:MFS transporter [Brevibacterium casei]|uniref:Drug resistance transporter, EmrB/QacA subfamily n=1 Tax=Brevibacterium casei CIP 102111 TaxID=1255625 RepID=A0A2H1JBB8_9MICO|nr:MFS transporter [Brevibacterium casei]QPR38957.1 MFS transporter [Brevibacterium casei]QPR43123.1 MFS transporter [Brevibacterium casei]SMX84786.1 drug resistance transporter, EmrB/QacA subfamily [Brevibacterium casei CIP 102111]